MLGKKKYLTSVMLENVKDATMVAGIEGYGAVNSTMSDIYPVNLIIQKPRTYLGAIIVSLKYSKMGIHNAILRQ